MEKMLIVAWFKIESNRYKVEEFIMGKTFKDISDLKEQSKNNGLIFDGWCDIEEFIINLNDEYYHEDNWVANCYVEHI